MAGDGHAWSPKIGRTGGRGLANRLGMLLVLFPEGGVPQVGVMLVGVWLHNELRTTVSLLSMPLFADVFRRLEAVTLAYVTALALTAEKQMDANHALCPQMMPAG